MRCNSLPRRALTLLILALFLLPLAAQEAPRSQAPAIPDRCVGPGPWHKLLVPADVSTPIPGQVLHSVDYGAFRLFVVEADAKALQDAGFELRDEQNLIALNAWVLDGLRPETLLAQLPRELCFGDPLDGTLDANAGLHLVQFAGPIKDEWPALLEGLGADFMQYVPMNAYVVRVPPAAVPVLESLPRLHPAVQMVSDYHPAMRLHPRVRALMNEGLGQPLPVVVQVVAEASATRTLERLGTHAVTIESAARVGPYLNVRARISPQQLANVARLPDVFQVELAGFAKKTDERQGQIIAGNVAGSGPSGPGYLAWLAGKGFDGTQFGSFAINVVDDSWDLNGHPDLPGSRVAFGFNPANGSGPQEGHGFLNAHIVGGFNDATGSSAEDSGGYNYGLGIAPWARVGVTNIFGPSGASRTSLESTAWLSGSRISTNSWGYVTFGGAPIPDYNSGAQEYDFIARDARSATSGNQELSIFTSAGNDGSGSNTVSSPATAKNIISVGASENNRQTGTDGCGFPNSAANNINQIIGFSSRGPVNAAGGDGRHKPEIVAPGTHIQAGVPQSNYNGAGVCNTYFPSGQTLYSWSTGTSHSCPGVAGAGALAYQHFLNEGRPAPSPAMMKAWLTNSATYVTGTGGGDTLPSDSQGMGRCDLGRGLDDSARFLLDQTQVLGATGQSWTSQSLSIGNTNRPVRISLAWTDAPGPTTGAPWVNDLDLTVSVNGTTYRGNVFSGANSVTGGASDIRNNLESVFLPAGTSGTITVTVTAASIGGNGIPGNADPTDQDFAVVVYNAGTISAPPSADFVGSPLTGGAPLLVNFTDTSTGGVTGWLWNFGDGNLSTSQNPSHTYMAPGSYTVSLLVSGPGGTDSLVRSNYVTVSDPPVASFTGTPTTGTAPLLVNFTDTSTGGPTGWLWNFGDGNLSTSQNPSHTYMAPGNYTVSLLVSNAVGSDVVSVTNYVTVSSSVPAPVAEFTGTPTSGAAPLNVSFTDQSTGNVTGWSWDFGDGGSSTQPNPQHLYTAAGTYTVSLTATGPGGSDVETKTGYITVSSAAVPPVAEFSASPTSGMLPLGVQFSDLSTGDVTSWSWDFGDGGTATGQNPYHTYVTPGVYDVTLTTTGPGGSDPETKSAFITVTAPALQADVMYISFDTTTNVPGIGNVADDDIVAYDLQTGTWSMVFDGSDAGISPTDIAAFCILPNGDIAMSFNSSVIPVDTLVGGPEGIDVRENDIVLFKPVTLGTNTTGSFEFWFDGSDVGLAASSEDIDAIHVLPNGDLLISTNGDPSVPGLSGLRDEDVLRFTPTSLGENTAGTWSLELDAGSLELTSSSEDIDALSVDANGDLVFSTINAFDALGVQASDEDLVVYTGTLGANPSGSFALFQDLSLLGIATSEAIDGFHFRVDRTGMPPVASLGASTTLGTVPLTVDFEDLSTGTVSGWQWDFGDGQSSTAQNPTHVYSSPGVYTVSLVASGANGSDTIVRQSLVVVEPAVTQDLLYVSFPGAVTVNGVGSVADEDIVVYDSLTDSWSLYFDGSDVGLTPTDIDAFTVFPDGSIVMSFDRATSVVPGLVGGPDGTNVTENDLVIFVPTSTGSTTAGSFMFYFDGSDVGLTGGAEDIDGVHVATNGDIFLSVTGAPVVPGLDGLNDEDVIRFIPTSTGATTAGSFERWFDGSSAGLKGGTEDVNGCAFDAAGRLYFTTIGSWSTSGNNGTFQDVGRYTGTYGLPTVGFSVRFYDLSMLGGFSFASGIDAVSLQQN